MGTHGRIASWGRAAVALAVAASGLAALTAAPAQAASPLVVSLTFDDGLTTHYHAADILEAHGARGTFYVNSGAIDQRGGGGTMTWDQAQDLAARGHEIGGHTRDHVVENGLSDQDRWTQICEDRARMVEMGLAPTSFSYPEGVHTPASIEALVACGYQSARTTGGLLPTGTTQSETVPPAPGAYQIRSLGTTHNGPITLESLQAAVDAAHTDPDGNWLPMLFHWVCPDTDTASLTTRTRPISASVLKAFLAWIENDPRAISVAPLSEVFNRGAAVPRIRVTSPAAGGGVAARPHFAGSTSINGHVKIDILRGPYGLGSPIASITTMANARNFAAGPAAMLPAGVYTVRASLTAGGVTGTSVPVPFRVGPPDTAAPAPVITTPVQGANMSGSPASFAGTATTKPGDRAYAHLLIKGMGAGVPVTRDLRVSIFPGGKWSITPTMATGTYTARVRQSDRSGNTGTSAPVSFTVGIAPPVGTAVPKVGSMSSDTVGQGARKAVIRLFGKFRRGVTVDVSGVGVQTKVLHRRPRVLKLGLWVRPNAPVGARTLKLAHRDGGTFTCAGCLRVAPAPRATSLSRDTIARGTQTWVTVLGTGFKPSTVAAISGGGVRVTAVRLVNARRIRLAVHVAPTAYLRARNLLLVDETSKGRSVLRRALRIT